MNLILFLLLALTASWTGLVQCEDNKETEEDLISATSKVEGEEKDSENQGDGEGSGDGRKQDLDSQPNSDSNTDQTATNEEANSTTEANTDGDSDTNTEDLDPVMIIIPLVLTLVILAAIMCIVMIYRRWRIKVAEDTKGDPYLDHEDHEKVPMPMFDDDIPSVMELEMEDLENWMAKDGGKKVDTGQI